MSSAPLWAVGLAAGVSLALGGLLVRRRPEWTIEQRCLLFVLPGFGLLLLALCLGVVALMPFGDWNGARLSSSALLFHGYRLYYGPDEGPAMPTVYGPVSFLFFLPALLLRSLTGAILAAGLLNVMAIVAPLLVLHWEHIRYVLYIIYTGKNISDRSYTLYTRETHQIGLKHYIHGEEHIR